MRVRYITEAPQKENIYGVKVGDVFKSTWGYDQTNVDFYQVRRLVGSQSVEVEEVEIPEVSCDYYSHGMSANICYDIDPSIQYPASEYSTRPSTFVKRVKESGDSLYIDIASYANAYLVKPGRIKTYQSWYA